MSSKYLNHSHILSEFGGEIRNNLNNLLLSGDVDSDIDISSFSPYVSEKQLPNYVNEFKDNFSVLTLNCQSINAKFDKLQVILQYLINDNKLHFSVIFLQETWLKYSDNFDEIISTYTLHGYKKPFGIPASSSTHGGLLCYIKESFDVTVINEYKSSNLWEGMFLKISGNKIKPTLVGNIYRPPRCNNNNIVIDQFLGEFLPFITKISEKYNSVVLSGDFNIDLLKINEREKYALFLDSMLSLGLVPKITLPTRFAKYSASLIDQIFVKSPDIQGSNNRSGILFTSLSDHLAPFIFLNKKLAETKSPKFVSVTKHDEISIKAFIDSITNANITSKIDRQITTDPNITQEIIESEIKHHINKHLPTKLVKFNRYLHKKSPWITKGILHSMQYRDKLYYKLKTSNPNTAQYQIFKTNYDNYSKIINKLIKSSKTAYYNHEFEKYKSDIKKTWSTINSVLGRSRKNNEFPKYIYSGNKKIVDKKEIANKLNDYFSTIGEKLSSKIPRNGKSFESYLKNRILTSFSFKLINTDDVNKVIHKFKPKTSTGDDGISTKLLKLAAGALAEPIAILINQSLTTGIFPTRYKLAKVIPLLKKSNNYNTDNVRHISLLSSISKVMEKCVFIQLYAYFEENRLLYGSQYGYRKKHSTETACIELVDKLYQQLDNNETPFCIFLDLSKAFDTLDHKILISKLKYYGLDQNAIEWFSSYLSNRSQYVEIDSVKSNLREIKTGVPQGSILGPLLFIIYINDINTVSSAFRSILYADDTSLNNVISFFTQGNTRSLSAKINAEINLIFEWLNTNGLSLNISKTKYMLFRYPQTSASRLPDLNLSVNGSAIERVDNFDFLRLVLNEKMSWNSHINKISRNISKAIGVMSRSKNVLNTSILLKVYNSLVLSRLHYGIMCWGFDTKNIFKIQKRPFD